MEAKNIMSSGKKIKVISKPLFEDIEVKCEGKSLKILKSKASLSKNQNQISLIYLNIWQ